MLLQVGSLSRALEPRSPDCRESGVLFSRPRAWVCSAALFALALSAAGCPARPTRESGPAGTEPPPKGKPEDAARSYVSAMDREDIQGVLDAVHPDSEIAESIEEKARFFASYDVRYEIESVEVREETDAYAVVDLVQTSKRVPGRGLPFIDNRAKVECRLRKHRGAWKVLTFTFGETAYFR